MAWLSHSPALRAPAAWYMYLHVLRSSVQSWCYWLSLCLFKILYSTVSLHFIGSQDLYLYYFLSRYPGRTLVFSNTVDCIRRLGSLFRLLNFDPWVLHASMQQRQRLKNLDRQAYFVFFMNFQIKKWNSFSHILNSLVFHLLMFGTLCFLFISFVLLIFFRFFFFSIFVDSSQALLVCFSPQMWPREVWISQQLNTWFIIKSPRILT